MAGNKRCLSKADDVSVWLQALIDKPAGKAAHRYYALVHLFAIRMKQQRFREALASAELALRLSPTNPRFGLMQAHALIGLKRLDDASRLLNELAGSSAGRVKKYAVRIQQLNHVILSIKQRNRKKLGLAITAK